MFPIRSILKNCIFLSSHWKKQHIVYCERVISLKEGNSIFIQYEHTEISHTFCRFFIFQLSVLSCNIWLSNLTAKRKRRLKGEAYCCRPKIIKRMLLCFNFLRDYSHYSTWYQSGQFLESILTVSTNKIKIRIAHEGNCCKLKITKRKFSY